MNPYVELGKCLPSSPGLQGAYRKKRIGRKKMAWGKKKDRPERPVIVAWSGKRDLNPRLQPWQGCTLPLSYSRKGKAGPKAGHYDLERETGFEPATSTLARLHSTTELFPPVEATSGFEPENGGFADLCLTTWLCRLFWSGKRDLNPRLQPWQGCTLPLSYSRSQKRTTVYPRGFQVSRVICLFPDN